jgi:hypothetical protein
MHVKLVCIDKNLNPLKIGNASDKIGKQNGILEDIQI